MNAPSDLQLLHASSDHHSEEAFHELVRRHIDRVHSAAVRLVRGGISDLIAQEATA